MHIPPQSNCHPFTLLVLFIISYAPSPDWDIICSLLDVLHFLSYSKTQMKDQCFPIFTLLFRVTSITFLDRFFPLKLKGIIGKLKFRSYNHIVPFIKVET